MRQRGFSLIEAMVALTILAGATLALFGWINTSLNQLGRAGLYTQVSPALNSVREYLAIVDLGERPEGTFRFGGISIDWQAQPIEQNATIPPEQGGSNFLVSLYRVALTPKAGGRTLPPLYTRVVSYRLKPGAEENPLDL